ncbi:MAG: asparagine synthase (glutamine-hydrolyzing) [Polyangiaceae bacterium]
MCGIFGALFTAAGEPVDIDRTLRVLRHRGPDSRGVFRSEDAVLAHTRLAIVDLSEGGHQPMASADGRYVTVFNGEIYNHHDLRRDLEGRGARFRSRSDTEVIVEGYAHGGERFLERLDGMFALAVFDCLDRRLVLMRDRTGKKPLFYTARSGSFRFASEIRALLASGFATDIDVAKLPLLLSLGYVPAPDTLYAGVRQLPPASILRLEPGKEPAIREYWAPRFDGPRLTVSPDVAQREVRRLVDQAVQRRMESDVPLGAFLSGGIDSTIVVGLMARASTRPIKTFSIGFSGDRRFDETDFARLAASAFSTDHTEFIVDPSSFDLIDPLVEVHDGPFGDASAIPTSIVSRLARAHVTVALGGDGGDELFCGYARLLAAEAGDHVPAPVLRAAVRLTALVSDSGSPRSFARRAKRMVAALSLPLPQRMLRWQSFFVDDLEGLMRADLLERVDPAAAAHWIDGVARRCGDASPLATALGINFLSYLPYDLLVKADRAAMLHSLELRSPFLDTALVEYVTALPDGMKRRGLTSKWILRRAFADLVPQAIARRSKMGFGAPLGRWFRAGLRSYVRDTFGPSARLYQYVRREFVSRLLDQHESGLHDHEYKLWLLITMERWLQLLPTWC